MANYPQRMNKSMMNSPYYQSFQQGQGVQAPRKPKSFAPPPTGGMAYPTMQPGAYPQNAPYFPQQQARPKRTSVQTPPLSKKQIRKLERQKRREKDYFFVMRKFTSFLIFLFSLVLFAVVALPVASKFVALPEPIGGIVDKNLSMFTIADNTPLDERDEEYIDTSVYVSFGDLVLGAVGNVAKNFTELGFLTDEEGNSITPFYDETLAGLEAIEDPNDTMAPIAAMIFKFAPLGLILVIIIAFITMIKGFVGMFGKRIFKRFGLSAIIMIIFAVATLVGGLAALGLKMGNPQMLEDTFVGVLDFNNLLPFLTGFINNPPATAIDPLATTAPVVMQAGLGSLILVVASVLVLFLSFFARKKMPYSIFDR
ncbi:MAG: hypothetical protein WC292_07380 [Clostridia bacterium]